MERVLKTWALVFLFILFWGSVRTGLYANAVYVCGQAYTCGCMWLFAHSQKPEEDCEHRDLSSFILSLWSRVSHWSQSHTSGQQASVILLFLPFHSPGVTGKCVHTQFFFTKVSGVQAKILMLTKQAILSTEPSPYSQELYLSTWNWSNPPCSSTPAGMKPVNFTSLNDLLTLSFCNVCSRPFTLANPPGLSSPSITYRFT